MPRERDEAPPSRTRCRKTSVCTSSRVHRIREQRSHPIAFRTSRPPASSLLQAAKEPLRIPVEDVFKHILGVALVAPVSLETLVREKRIVRSEHDTLLQPARNLVFERGREVFRRPSMHLIPDV